MTKKKWGKYMKSRVLLIGPDVKRSKGGMATVIEGLMTDEILNQDYDISCHASYRDGSLLVRMLYSLYAFFKFCFVYRQYDVFHIHMASYGSTFRKKLYVDFIKKRKKKVILHMHGGGFITFYEKLSDRKKQQVTSLLKKADCVVALSDVWKKEFVSRFGLDNCIVIENGIDTVKFAEAATDVRNLSQAFLFLGRLGERKGIYDLIEAVALLRDRGEKVHCYLAGAGECEKVNRVISEKHLEMYMTVVGWVDDRGRIEQLKQVSTLILPSYHEGLPMAILEGMAAGKAIISTKVGAIPEVVENGVNGYLIEPGDIEALAEAMYQCSKDVDSLAAMSLNNREKIAHQFSRRRMHQKVAECYKRMSET